MSRRRGVSRLGGELVAFLRERDPAHLAYINLLPTYASNEQLGNKGDTVAEYREHLRSFVETVKPAMLSYDHYHFMKAVKSVRGAVTNNVPIDLQRGLIPADSHAQLVRLRHFLDAQK